MTFQWRDFKNRFSHGFSGTANILLAKLVVSKSSKVKQIRSNVVKLTYLFSMENQFSSFHFNLPQHENQEWNFIFLIFTWICK